MKKILSNQKGVTLIESLAATVIIVLLLGTLLGALVFGQKVIVGSDEKNRAAAEAQEIIDTLMEDLSSSPPPEIFDGTKYSSKWTRRGSTFAKPKESTPPEIDDILPRQYYILPIDKEGNSCSEKSASAYRVYVRVYYNQGEAYVDLSAYVKKGGVGD